MHGLIRLALPIALCLLAFGAWLAFAWLPADAPGPRGELLVWLGVELVVALTLLWWTFQRAFGQRLSDLLHLVRGSAPLAATGGGAQALNPVDEIARHVQGLNARLANADAALADEARHRRSTQTALHETQERYALAVRGAEDGLWEWDIATDAMFLSPRWKAMAGFAEDELSNRHEIWRARIHPKDSQTVERTLQAHLAGATPRYESEHRLLHKSGQARWVLSRGTALRHASGKPYRMIGLDTDITAYKRIEATLQHVAAGTANAVGAEFYRAMVQHFAQALEVTEAFITECVDHPPTHVRTLACWERGKFITDEYDLAPTPCKIVFESKERYFVPRDLAVHFPNEAPYGFVSYLGSPILDSRGRILGHLVFKDDKPMDESILMDSVYRIFTARAGAEMERSVREKTLLRVAQGFDALSTPQQRLTGLVSAFAHYMGAREAFLTRCLDDPPTRVRALCYWKDGESTYDVEYDLAGNPCETVYGEAKPLYWPRQLGVRWPLELQFGRESYVGLPLVDPANGRVLGHFACCDDRAMIEEAPAQEALALFARRGYEALVAQLDQAA
jgi:PAS domain S-box-containing protein